MRKTKEGLKKAEKAILRIAISWVNNSKGLTVALYLDTKGAVRHFEGLLGLFGEPVDGTLGRADDALAVVGLKKPEALMYEGSRRCLSNLVVGEHHGDHHRRVA